MFKTKLFKVAYAITIAEGWKARFAAGYPDGTASYINHNPGNVRASPFQLGESSNQFAVFENDLVGYYAVVHQLYLYASGKSMVVPPIETIEQAISHYNDEPIGTPAFESYIEILEQVGGVNRKDQVSTLLDNSHANL